MSGRGDTVCWPFLFLPQHDASRSFSAIAELILLVMSGEDGQNVVSQQG